MKDSIIRDIRNLFENQEKDYYKPVRVNNFQSNNYIEYKGKCDRKNYHLKNMLRKLNHT